MNAIQLLVLLLGFLAFADAVGNLTSIFPTFHSIGVTVDLEAGDDPDRLGNASLWYRQSGSSDWIEGHPLVRTRDTRYVGSVFFVNPSTTYDIKVRVSTDSADLLGSVTTRSESEVEIPVASKTYHISPTGFGSNCTLELPCNFSTAMKIVQPGEEILMADGIYYEGEHYLPCIGTEEKPIVIRRSKNVIWDGSYPTPLTWTLVSGTIYKTTVTRLLPHVVVANGIRLWPYVRMSDMENQVAGWPGFYIAPDSYDLYINLEGQPIVDPNLADVKVARKKFGIISNNYIRYYGFTMRYYGAEVYGKGILSRSGNNGNVISGMTFILNDASVAFEGSNTNSVVQDCEFYDTMTGMDHEQVKTYPGEIELEIGAIQTFGNALIGRGIVIRRNYFTGSFDTITPSHYTEDDLPLELDIYDNYIYTGGDEALSLDGPCRNCRVWNNTIRNSQTGISFAPNDQGPVFAIRNKIYTLSMDSQTLKFNSGYAQRGHIFVYHNTAISNGPASAAFAMYNGVWEMITSRNNIFVGNASYCLINDYPLWDRGVDLDYNMYWRATNATNFAVWGIQYATLEDFQNAGFNQEMHGWWEKPEFVDWMSGNMDPVPGAAQIDRGIRIPGINDLFYGDAPDLGAVEYNPNPPVSPFASGSPAANAPKDAISSANNNLLLSNVIFLTIIGCAFIALNLFT